MPPADRMRCINAYTEKNQIRLKIMGSKENKEDFHQDIELIYVIEGSMEMEVGGQRTVLKSEDMLVVNAFKMHKGIFSPDVLYARLSIPYELISDMFNSTDIIFWCDSTRDNSEHYEELRCAIRQLLNNYVSTQGKFNNFRYLSLCYRVMDILSTNFLVRSSDRENWSEEDKFNERLMQINNYIRTYFRQPISLKDLSKSLYLSIGYLSRFFKKNYGVSFSKHLSDIRVYHATDDLLYTNAPITRIAYDNGFSTVTVFNKTFKSVYGETPSAFRRKANQKRNEKTEEDDSASMQKRLEQALLGGNMEPEESVETNTVQAEYSAAHSRKVEPIWNKMVNIGAAEDLLRSEVQEHVILLKERLGFESVRFWNIFSKHLLIDITQPEENLNFTVLDSILDFLLQQNVKPHIELGQKPKRIHKNVQSFLVFDDTAPRFTSLEQWRLVMDALMRHLVHRYGVDELTHWRMELWFDERTEMDSDAVNVYFQLFNIVYEVVKSYCSELEIGGCGIQTQYNLLLNHAFLRRWKEQEKQPDFLSVIVYPYVRGEERGDRYSKRSTDPAFLMHAIQSVKADMETAGMNGVKLYVTEWNLTISDRNFINDTCFKGAYIIRNALDVYGKVDLLGYFLGSDLVSTYYDSNALLQGGTGLFSKDSILKPAGFAFDFLNRLYPYFIGKGKNFLLTTDQHGTYGLVCHNQKDLNYNYFFSDEDQIEKEHIWRYFDDRNALSIHLKLTDIKPGVYQMKVYRVNEYSGSMLDIWREMGYDRELPRNDIEYFRRICEPKLSLQKYEVKNNYAEIDIDLAPNEFAFIRLTER